MKLTSRVKRREREKAESVSAVETERRTEALSKQFMEWSDGKKIELALVNVFFCTKAVLHFVIFALPNLICSIMSK